MPLIFSESEETQNQQKGLFEEIKDADSPYAQYCTVLPQDNPELFYTFEPERNVVATNDSVKCDSYKTYNSCTFNEKEPSPLETKYENLSNSIHKSEESSLDLDTNFDKNGKHVYIFEDPEDDSVVETTALRQASEPSNSTLDNSIMSENYLTVSGTIKRGKKKGQSVEVVLNMSREELEILEANMVKKKGCLCHTKNGTGFHVTLWTILCLPFSFLISGVYSFCIGTITWYNVFKLFSEEKAIGYRILVPPLLIILYPFLIISISLGMGIYAGVKQVSCSWDSWHKEFTDYEKGFYGWLCNSLDIPECCPYEVVILSSIQKP